MHAFNLVQQVQLTVNLQGRSERITAKTFYYPRLGLVLRRSSSLMSGRQVSSTGRAFICCVKVAHCQKTSPRESSLTVLEYPSPHSMSHPTASTAKFQSVLDGALDSYVKQTGVDITKHPSADKLQDCHSPEDIIQLLLERETAFKDYRDTRFCDLIERLRPAVRVVHALSDVLGEAGSLVSSEAPGAVI